MGKEWLVTQTTLCSKPCNTIASVAVRTWRYKITRLHWNLIPLLLRTHIKDCLSKSGKIVRIKFRHVVFGEKWEHSPVELAVCLPENIIFQIQVQKWKLKNFLLFSVVWMLKFIILSPRGPKLLSHSTETVIVLGEWYWYYCKIDLSMDTLTQTQRRTHRGTDNQSGILLDKPRDRYA